LFFGGWLSPIPGLPDGVLWIVIKIVVMFFLFAMVKAIVPRYRYDQLMRLGWKVFLPFSLFWVVLTATVMRAFDIAPWASTAAAQALQ
ncbi:MAG: NADH-quinone oxidoreductase subunit H, partial [Pseudomonadota bacterium]